MTVLTLVSPANRPELGASSPGYISLGLHISVVLSRVVKEECNPPRIATITNSIPYTRPAAHTGFVIRPVDVEVDAES